jgi:hypothetical protein
MLDVLDCIEENDLDIELVKETFDRTVAPVKAWAARMELDAKHDRTMMGIANRLASGKTWNNNTPYGYRSDDGSLHLDAEQAEVVRSIWTWYADDVAVAEIRRRLISSGAPQVQDGHKIPWKPAYIRALLRRQCYHTGLYTITWDGETYEIPIPPIIDAETAARVKQRRAGFKKYPAGNLRSQVLAAGLVYCEACGIKMMVSPHSQRKNGKEYRYVYYACPYKSRGTHQPGCAGWVRYERIDAELWDRVWALISDPDRFEAALQERIAFLQAQDIDAEAECSRLQEALDNLMMERQRVITWARKKLITEDDMELQLGGLQFQEMGLKRELAEKSLLVGGQAQRLQELARLYREDVQTGAAILTGEPETEEEEKLQFEFRQKIVQELVKRVDVGADRSLTIQAELNFAAREFVDQDQACLLGK